MLQYTNQLNTYYFLKVKPELDRVFRKLIKKNRKLYEIIMKTADEVILNPQHYANLRVPLQDWKRV